MLVVGKLHNALRGHRGEGRLRRLFGALLINNSNNDNDDNKNSNNSNNGTVIMVIIVIIVIILIIIIIIIMIIVVIVVDATEKADSRAVAGQCGARTRVGARTRTHARAQRFAECLASRVRSAAISSEHRTGGPRRHPERRALQR